MRTVDRNKFETIHNNPLDPQYIRYSDSRRHVQVYGEIEGGKPKQHIAPKTRRQTNMVDDILGAQVKNTSLLQSRVANQGKFSAIGK